MPTDKTKLLIACDFLEERGWPEEAAWFRRRVLECVDVNKDLKETLLDSFQLIEDLGRNAPVIHIDPAALQQRPFSDILPGTVTQLDSIPVHVTATLPEGWVMITNRSFGALKEDR